MKKVYTIIIPKIRTSVHESESFSSQPQQLMMRDSNFLWTVKIPQTGLAGYTTLNRRKRVWKMNE